MNKSQQMRWSRRGADLMLQVRCAVYNGTLGFGFGQRFEPIGRPQARGVARTVGTGKAKRRALVTNFDGVAIDSW